MTFISMRCAVRSHQLRLPVGRRFAAAGSGGPPASGPSLKTSDLAFEMLVEQGLARPASYAARFKWVQRMGYGALSDADLTAYLAQTHAIVAAGLIARRGPPWGCREATYQP